MYLKRVKVSRYLLVVIGIFLLLPILAIVPLAFTESLYLKLQGFTFKWIIKILLEKQWQEAFANSLVVSLGTALVSVLISVLTAISLRNFSKRIQMFFYSISLLPLQIPIIILACSLLKWFYIFNLVDTHIGLIAAHSLLTVPISLLIINSALTSFHKNNPNIEFAAILLNIKPITFFLKITLHAIKRAVLIAFTLSFTISFNEASLAQFLSVRDTVLIGKKLYDGLKFEITPEIAAVSFMLLLMTFFCSILYKILSRNNEVSQLQYH